jgi:ribosomal protein S18 acetylase RimI-like enzyme
MTEATQKPEFAIELASESDWDWILQGQIEIELTRLSRDRHVEVSLDIVWSQARDQMHAVRGPQGYPNAAYVAKAKDEQRAGFVWVAEVQNDATGANEGYVLSEFVAEPFRGQGLGRLLMSAAEEWARQRRLPRIALSVGAGNVLAQRLFETLGYAAESVRLSKDLQTAASSG